MIINPQLAGDAFFWPGTGPKAHIGILLSHGFSATAAEVRLLAERLHAAGYTVAGPLLPGHKTTSEDLNIRRWPEWVATIETTHAQLKQSCDQILVGGESLGGLLALYHASRHPEVAAILTYSPAIQLKFLTRLGAALLAPFVKEFKPQAGPHTKVDDYWQGYAVRPAQAVRQLVEFNGVVRRLLPKVQPPLLIVQGCLDQTIDTSGADLLYTRVGSHLKELHWMEKSSHCVILDQELPQVADLTLNFITKVLQAETA